jgi:hypothetical protein
MQSIFLITSRVIKKWRLLFFKIVFTAAGLLPAALYAHQSPNTLIFLDVSPGRIAMEIQLPVPELELAFGNDISKKPETITDSFGPQLKEYLKAHIHAYVTKSNPWQVEIESLKMAKGTYAESGAAYWEVVAYVNLKPQPGESTRKFLLDYDVILHQVINHVALLSIRSDWETGNSTNSSAQANVINWNTKDNVIYPLEINLENGSWWKGFKNMLALGMEHIKDGTDHLLFLIVLLLPAMLLVNGNHWGKFGGTKYSIVRLLKIVTAFTIGHSVTLLIGAAGWLKLPAQPVEILIAFSILVSAMHALYPIFPGKEMYVAAGFGLIHGLAFATILSNLKLSAGTLVVSIVGFNLGIELMQVFIIALIIPWLIILSKTFFYKWFRIAAGIMAGLAAIAWIVERTINQQNFITKFIENNAAQAVWLIIPLAFLSVIAIIIHRNKKQPATA